MRRTAFTLVELLLSLGILLVVSALAIPSYRYYQIVADLDRASDQVTQGLYRARHLAMSNAADGPWGLHVPEGVLFSGDRFTTRNIHFDEKYSLPPSVTASGIIEVSFSPLKGIPSATGSIILTAVNGLQRVITILGEGGVIVKDPEGERLTICHYAGGKKNTIKIAESAWPGHREQHGDVLGPCH